MSNTKWDDVFLVRWWQDLGHEFFDAKGSLLCNSPQNELMVHWEKLDNKCIAEGLCKRKITFYTGTCTPEYIQWVRTKGLSENDRQLIKDQMEIASRFIPHATPQMRGNNDRAYEIAFQRLKFLDEKKTGE